MHNAGLMHPVQGYAAIGALRVLKGGRDSIEKIPSGVATTAELAIVQQAYAQDGLVCST